MEQQAISLSNVFVILGFAGCLFVHYLAVVKSIGKVGERVTKVEVEQEIMHKVIDRDFRALSTEVRNITLKCRYKSTEQDVTTGQ